MKQIRRIGLGAQSATTWESGSELGTGLWESPSAAMSSPCHPTHAHDRTG